MTTFFFDHDRQHWVLECFLCLTWHQTVFETANGDLCRRCLNRPDHQEGVA